MIDWLLPAIGHHLNIKRLQYMTTNSMQTIADSCNTGTLLTRKAMYDHAQRIKNTLNIRSSDFFIAYGMSQSSRFLVDHLRQCAEVSVALVADKQELEICEGIRTKIFESINDIGGLEVFDKVYCNYSQLPMRKQHHQTVLEICYKLCVSNGMVLIENMNNKNQIEKFIQQNRLQKYWYMNQCDLLFKKDSGMK